MYTEKTFNVSVTAVNQQPTDISLFNASVAENQPVGHEWVRSARRIRTWATRLPIRLSNGQGSAGTIASFTISGDTLQTGAIFNYDAKSTYKIRVQSTDQDGLFTQKIFP